jgi:uncharacterized membrane protein YhhN
VLLVLFVVAAAVRLVATEVETSVPLGQYANYALVSSLALWVLARRGPVLVAVALGFGWVGDVLLHGGDDLRFLLGMGAFGVGHICWVTHFWRTGAFAGVKRRWYVALLYVAALGGLVAWLWSGLGDLAVPMVGYGVLLTATAVFSAGAGLWTGLGGAMFFISDGFIAVDIADGPAWPHYDLRVMATYIAAQTLLATGAVRRAR